jgi:hypothetical protein
MIEREPLFSLLHATARIPWGWKKAHDEWMASADDPTTIEYLLAIDAAEVPNLPVDFGAPWTDNSGTEGIDIIHAPVYGSAPVWNCAAKHATGKILITIADDWQPCPHWDTEIKKVIPDLNGEYVVEVSCGGEADVRRLMVFSILTRARYNRYGYIFHPDYLGLYADDDFTAMARRDNVVIDARHLMLPHMHFTAGLSPIDPIYQRQNSNASIMLGQQTYERRKAAGFPA